MEMYNAALSRMESVRHCLPAPGDELAETIKRNGDEVRRKVERLRRSKAVERVGGLQEFPVQFTPGPSPVEDYRAPRSVHLRVYWLMRLLSRSIQQGAYITPDVYVPRDVWFQEGGGSALHHIGVKVKCLSRLCEAMSPLRSMTTLGELQKTAEALRTFLKRASQLREALSKDMGLSTSTTAEKEGVWGLLSRKAKQWSRPVTNYDLCLTWATNALDQSQLFERWLVYFTEAATAEGSALRDGASSSSLITAQDIVLVLHQIGVELYHGICCFLLHDMSKLVCRFQDKCRKSAVKMTSVELKLISE